jgi:hypothetical protein
MTALTLHTDRFSITNPGRESIDLVIEPWIAELQVAPGATLDVVGWSADEGGFQWDEATGTLYGWSSSEARATVNGTEVWKSFAPCPSMPAGVSIATFFGTLGLADGEAQ